jgi:pimeloyl-ACP methyl ester carboxylesterase
MPYTTNDGIRIFYDVEGSGTPLVMHVGFLGSAEDWRREDTPYTAALRERYQVILLDPRGQGQSDTPHDPAAYSHAARTGDVLAVADAVGADRFHFWGYSMGGTVGFNLATHYPERLLSLISGGANPTWDMGNPADIPIYQWLQRGMDGFVEEWERELGPLPAGVRERYLGSDARALIAAVEGMEGPEAVVAALPTMQIPALLYAGTEDYPEPVEKAAQVMPNATFIPLDGLNHPQAFRRHDLILPHVLDFLERVDQSVDQRADA